MLSDLVKRCLPLPGRAKLLILGAGYSGRCLANLAQSLGTPVLCSRRSRTANTHDLVFDSLNELMPNWDDLVGVTHLISTIPPDQNGNDPVLTTLLPLLSRLPLQWAGYLSTTGVYGDRDGAWVSENDQPEPGQARSCRRLACEQAWQSSGLPVQILRLPGIYGPGRSVLVGLQRGTARLIEKPGQVFCRIHVEDIAGACWHLINQAATGHQPAIVNVVDDCPAPSADLLRYAANLLNCALPETEAYEVIQANMSTMARSFWSENRRVSNRRLCQDLGYSLLHPSYKTGLQDCLVQDGFSSAQVQNPDHQSTSD